MFVSHVNGPVLKGSNQVEKNCIHALRLAKLSPHTTIQSKKRGKVEVKTKRKNFYKKGLRN